MQQIVENQPDWPETRDPWHGDEVLRHYASCFGAQVETLEGFGATVGSAALREAGREAERHPPELERFDRRGARVDRVRFHPAYHRLMQAGICAGYAALPWEGNAKGGHATHAAMVYLLSQTEPGVCCPMTMTYAAAASLGSDHPDLVRLIASRAYDPSEVPIGKKRGATFGMAMTEKQGGSDVQANTTRAEPDGEGVRLYGHKWFCSAPMSDAFLTLARGQEGLSCFLVPRLLPDGTLNEMHLMRLKEKLGNRANASAEVEYRGAWALPVGAPGQGVRTIIPMVHHTRLDTAMAPAGLMRAALAEALHWCEGRRVFQRRLIDQPLMRAVLADLVLDWEAATALGLRVAAAYDAGADEAPLARVAVALAKFLSNKRAPGLIYECMECLGGMGYVEDTPLPMLYREAPLNSIWEGSGNVICLDILRSLEREDCAEALREELKAATGSEPAYDAALAAHFDRWQAAVPQAEARLFVERTAVLLSASVLIRHGPGVVAAAYLAGRLEPAEGRVAGAVALPEDALIGRLGTLA